MDNVDVEAGDVCVELYDRVYWFKERLTCAVDLLRAVKTAMCAEGSADDYLDELIGLESYFELILESFEPVRAGVYSLARPLAE